jgi:hypothetical protein
MFVSTKNATRFKQLCNQHKITTIRKTFDDAAIELLLSMQKEIDDLKTQLNKTSRIPKKS